MPTDLEKLNQIRSILDTAPAAQPSTSSGPALATPLIHYAFDPVPTAFSLAVVNGSSYTLETIGGVAGNGAGQIEVHHPDSSNVGPVQRIVNGYGYFYFKAAVTETVTVLVTCDHAGLIRFAVA